MTELEKMHAVKEKSQAIGEFLEWLISDKELVIGRWDSDGTLHPKYVSIENLLAEFFGIDLKKVEKEKRAILDKIRGES